MNINQVGWDTRCLYHYPKRYRSCEHCQRTQPQQPKEKKGK